MFEKLSAAILTGAKKLEAEGTVDEAKGKVKGTFEDAKQAIKNDQTQRR